MEKFYRDALGFRAVSRDVLQDRSTERLQGLDQSARTLTMQLGKDRVEFMAFARAGRPYPRGSLSPDLWFQHFAIVVSDMDAAYARLRKFRFEAISVGGPQTLPEEDGRVRAFKFRDPDGHPLELLYFPAGQGRAYGRAPEASRAVSTTPRYAYPRLYKALTFTKGFLA